MLKEFWGVAVGALASTIIACVMIMIKEGKLNYIIQINIMNGTPIQEWTHRMKTHVIKDSHQTILNLNLLLTLDKVNNQIRNYWSTCV